MNRLKFPSGCSLSARTLFRLLQNKAISHREFQTDCASYRLAAWIYNLRRLGWPIADTWEVGLTSDPIQRYARYKRYRIDSEVLKTQQQNKGFSKRLDSFLETITKCEACNEKAPLRDA